MPSPLILLSVFCITFAAFNNGQDSQQFITLFEIPTDNFPLQNIEFDPQSNNFYVSGKNVLYKFNEDTKIPWLDKKTGPEAKCLGGLSEEDNLAYSGDDYNSVMVVTTDSIITCSTLRGGLCVRRSKEILDPETSSGNIRLVSDDSPSVGIFLNINGSNSGGEQKSCLVCKTMHTLALTFSKIGRKCHFFCLSGFVN